MSFILSGLFNRSQPNFYGHLKKIYNTKYEDRYFKILDLEKVKNIFEDAKMNDVIKFIDEEIGKQS